MLQINSTCKTQVVLRGAEKRGVHCGFGGVEKKDDCDAGAPLNELLAPVGAGREASVRMDRPQWRR